MAASGLEREDSLLEAHRTSLLEIIEDKNRAASKVHTFFIKYCELKFTKAELIRQISVCLHGKLAKNSGWGTKTLIFQRIKVRYPM